MQAIDDFSPEREKLYLGIDGGGTKCRARIVSEDDQLMGEGMGGPANPFQGVEQTLDSIQTATKLALLDAGLPASAISRLIAGVGLAGVNLPSLFAIIEQWQHPFRQMYLTTDLHIACLAAHNSDDGAVLVAGTGSCGYSFVNGRATIIGGHGFPCGDIGSGAWLGLEAIKAVLLAADHLGAPTRLSDSIGDHLQAKGIMIVDKMAAARPDDYARLAGLVLDAADAGDGVAESIVKQGAAYISAVAEKLWEAEPPRMSLLGGLAARLMPWLSPAVANRLSPPLNQPECGAIYYARERSKVMPGKGAK